ncbi:MAG TPA: metabolite traffic protein EboE [Geminicoccaceae bacterium]|nr:metabolite traffic protein EboE [Geminicoccaceae bacterium]
MKLGGALGHLTYCTNIHRGETWPEVLAALQRHLPAIKASVALDRPFGVGLRLSALAAEALRGERARAQLRDLLAAHDLYLFTLNGFPYGPFHGVRVKEEVYQPDWQREERLVYTDRLADLLAELMPAEPGLEGSISTVPGTFKPLAGPAGVVERIAENLVRHAAHLVLLRARTGRVIALALEPEPYCLLETVEETVRFFKQHLFADAAVERLAELCGLTRGDAQAALRRHLGVCYDVCHAAVEYEDPAGGLEALRAAGIRVPKLQLSAALRLAEVDRAGAERLRSFDEPVYLHQVVERRDGRLTRYLDLPQAFEALDGAAADDSPREWRVHFHVPIFLDEIEHFSTTQDFLREILAIHRANPVSAHLEVETYTWDVLPEQDRREDVATAIARELAWVRDRLTA